MSVLRKTDFPVPDGPSSAEISPAGSVSVTSDQTVCVPKDLVSPSARTSTPMVVPPPNCTSSRVALVLQVCLLTGRRTDTVQSRQGGGSVGGVRPAGARG